MLSVLLRLQTVKAQAIIADMGRESSWLWYQPCMDALKAYEELLLSLLLTTNDEYENVSGSIRCCIARLTCDQEHNLPEDEVSSSGTTTHGHNPELHNHDERNSVKVKAIEGWSWLGHLAGDFDTFVFVYCLLWSVE